ncbi:hypothetical protein [uncultured Rubinisphaera sp.]|uniref:hypothetical protein n=1 Tax=uncultured Rubinisphaera sp. TaxID=1678686 RepID=UPI0030DC5952|tara:strand:- start:87 stop:572 length:486 start_codon:yes stop_codon:yes gene_type:complete
MEVPEDTKSLNTSRNRFLISLVFAALIVLLLMFWTAYREQSSVAEIPGFVESRQTILGRVQAVHLNDVTDAEIHRLVLADLGSLKSLQISESQLSAAGIDEICQLDELIFLNLAGTSFPESEVSKLSQLSQLEKLDLTNCGIPSQVVIDLQKQIPETRIFN